MEFIQIEVAMREDLGTRHTRRARRAGMVPAVLYGMKRRNLSLSIAASEIERFLKTGSHLVELRLGEETRPAILREIQHDPITDEILHVDFHRVDHDHEVEDDVHITWKGRARGEGEGGVFQALKDTVRVRCRPRLLPAEFVVDIRELGVGDSIRVGALPLDDGVEFVDDPEDQIAHVALPRRVATPAAEEEPAEGEEAAVGATETPEAPGGETPPAP